MKQTLGDIRSVTIVRYHDRLEIAIKGDVSAFLTKTYEETTLPYDSFTTLYGDLNGNSVRAAWRVLRDIPDSLWDLLRKGDIRKVTIDY
jgi:hypothetical protein